MSQAFRESNFKGGQQPHAWLSSAEQLRAAAEVVLQHEAGNVAPYREAYRATQARLDDPKTNTAEIRADPPNDRAVTHLESKLRFRE